MRISAGKGVLAGIVGSLVMSGFGLWVAPLVGMPKMNPAEMLAGQFGSAAAGWAGHLAIGVVLALIYAAVVSSLPGPGVVRGALYSVAPFLLAQAAVMPMMTDMPMFSGPPEATTGSLVGHLVYGLVIGAVYGAPEEGGDGASMGS